MSGASGYQGKYPAPVMGYYFLRKSWNRMEREELQEHLNKAIHEDPYVSRPADVFVRVKMEGSDPTASIVGSAPSESEKQRIETIVEINTKDEMAIDNQLIVK